MNKRDFKNKMIIEPVKMAGDRWHNEDVAFFMEGVKQTPMTRKVQAYIVECFGSAGWIDRIFTKGDLRILRTLCRAKTKATVVKRQELFLKHQFKSHYGGLFNRNKIEKFMDMVM